MDEHFRTDKERKFDKSGCRPMEKDAHENWYPSKSNKRTVWKNASKKFDQLGPPEHISRDGWIPWYKCHYCWKHFIREDMTVDHKIPVSKGGKNNKGNLVRACQPCNLDKGTSDYDKFMEKTKHLRS